MAKREPITAELLREHLRYNPKVGDFDWLIIIPGRTPKPGSRHTKGYMRISVFQRRYQSHRLAWLWMTGKWPPKQIDHIDRNKANNRWANLRLATNQQNTWNRKHRLPKSGLPGVRQLRHGRWHARVGQHHVGVFDTAVEAYEAYQHAALQIKGEFAPTMTAARLHRVR